MSRDLFNVELGLGIFDENGLDTLSAIISGTAAPDGTSGKQQDVSIGSLYLRSGTGETYRKIANAGAPADWELLGSGGGGLGNWRPERVDAHTGQILVAGVTDPTAWVDNDGAFDGTLATVGHYVLDGNCDLWEITATASATSITLAAAGDPPAAQDMFAVRYNLPDPAGQEGQAIITFDGISCIKVADVDFAFADGIALRAPYTPASGDITSSDTVQSAIEKLDGNNDAQDSVLGTAQGDTDLGTFPGSTISDNTSVKGALTELEAAYEETDQNVDDLITLTGMPENSTDLGTFPGGVISDNVDIKTALTELEAKDEAQDGIITEIDQNVDDLIALSGVPENSTNLGAFTGYGAILFTATETVKSALQKVADFLGGLRPVKVTGVTAATPVDQVPVATTSACKWLVEATEDATPANKKAMVVYGLNNGTLVDDTVYARLKVGANFNLDLSVDISGGNMRLIAASSTAGVTIKARRLEVVDA